jgi:hypothetical protein
MDPLNKGLLRELVYNLWGDRFKAFKDEII